LPSSSSPTDFLPVHFGRLPEFAVFAGDLLKALDAETLSLA
jgi:hypothetical protein